MAYTVPTLTKLFQHPTTKKHKRAYEGSAKFQAALRIWKYEVQGTEVEITDPQIHYTMSVGFLAKQGRDVCLLREYIGEESQHDQHMEPPLDTLVDSILHRELYQLLLACIILEKRYQCHLYDHAFVIQVHPQGVTRHSLPRVMIEQVETVYAQEVARLTTSTIEESATC